MELRLGNQQRHSITAVLLSAVVIVFGLVIADVLSGSEPDPLGSQTEAVVSTTEPEAGPEDGDGSTAGVARSNSRFTLAPDLTIDDGNESTTSEPPPTTAAGRATTTASTTTTTTPSTSSTDSPSTATTATSSSTTEPTIVKPPGRPTSTTVDVDETTTTKKCRGNRPGCRDS